MRGRDGQLLEIGFLLFFGILGNKSDFPKIM
jgi:hypothetical protein